MARRTRMRDGKETAENSTPLQERTRSRQGDFEDRELTMKAEKPRSSLDASFRRALALFFAREGDE
jgi:hypothetical protein